MARNGRSLDCIRRELDITIYELWVAYVSLGGSSDAFVLKGYLGGTLDDDAIAPLDPEIIEQALAEIHVDLGIPRPHRPPH